jgi:ABC-2 type transport system ATP-binding protein
MAQAMASDGWTIDLSDVSKMYSGKVHALRGVDLRVARGEVFGLLGPNGAGKSTLVKILMTIIRPTTAKGNVLGQPVGHRPTLARIGYLPEHHRFPEYLTAAQVLDYYGGLTGIDRATRRARIPALLDMVGMSAWAKQQVKKYSKGMRQRVGIAQALMADPALVILDEPTDGVDPVGRRDIRELLVRLKGEGRTVFLNSHLLSELEMVCDRVAIMVQGKVASQGTIDELTTGQRRHEIELEPGIGEDVVRAALAGVASIRWLGRLNSPELRPGVGGKGVGEGSAEAGDGLGGDGLAGDGLIGAGMHESTVVLRTDDARAVQPCIDAVRRAGLVIRSVVWKRPSLEDLFMQAVVDPTTGRALAPGAKGGAR